MFNKNFLKKFEICKNSKFKENIFFNYNLYIDGFLKLILCPDIKKYKKSIYVLKDEHLNLKSKFNNFKKRSNDDLSKTYKYAAGDFFEDLLPILDSLESALLDKSGNVEKVLEGISLILKLFINIFEKNNVKVILPKIGENFDPYKHMAISVVNFKDANIGIFNVLQKGYSIFDRIIRPALVVVNKV